MKSDLLPVEDAIDRINNLITPLQGKTKQPIESASRRILAWDIISDVNVPPADNSAMDGYAFRIEDLSRQPLKLVGKSFAGHPFNGDIRSGEAIRIMTGALVPSSADTVVMQEQVTCEDDSITISSTPTKGENIRCTGEDIRQGTVVLPAGTELNPAKIAVLASIGIAEVEVFQTARVGIFSTGDELQNLGEPLSPGKIYDSNRYALLSMLLNLPVEIIDYGVLPDQPDVIEETLTRASQETDMIITSGGVSVGEADFVKQLLDKLGEVNFWRIAMKPGKPLAVGKIGKAVFFGLPGNPVSVMATFYQFAQRAIRRLAGQADFTPFEIRVPCGETFKKSPGRTDFQRGILRMGEDGSYRVYSTGGQGSHMLTSMAQANCFVLLEREAGDVAEGELVRVQPFSGIIS